MPDKITKISISENADSKKDQKVIPNEDTETTEPVATEEKPVEKTTVTGEKRIEPLSSTDTVQDKTTEPTQATEQQEHPTPDSSQIMTARAEEQMQNPKLFDTKEYHLPITQSVHGHGSKLVSILFGILFAVVVVGAALYFLQ